MAKFIVEKTLKNAIAWAKREGEKYRDSYGYGLNEISEIAQELYYLRDEEKEYLTKALSRWDEKNILKCFH